MSKEVIDECIGVGRRKTAVSSVRLRKGTGKVKVNDRAFEDYFPLEFQRESILAPLRLLNVANDYDLVVRIHGGGIEAQAIATRLGVARALVEQDEIRKATFKPLGYLTRDPRKKERKKYGLAGARKRFQFSKR